MMWGMVTILAIFISANPADDCAALARWIWPMLYRIPIIGPVFRWSHLVQFGRLMGLLLGQQVPLPDWRCN